MKKAVNVTKRKEKIVAIIKLTHVQTYLGQTMNNRYFYFTPAAVNVPVLDDLADVFNTLVVPVIKDLQSAGVNHIRLDTVELNGVSFSSFSISGAGNVIGEASPSWNALSFRLSRTNNTTKSGGKRIGGLSEIVLANNGLAGDPTYQGFIDTYADLLDDTLVGFLDSYQPVLVKFNPLVPGAILAYQPVAGGSFNGLSTQVTRRP